MNKVCAWGRDDGEEKEDRKLYSSAYLGYYALQLGLLNFQPFYVAVFQHDAIQTG